MKVERRKRRKLGKSVFSTDNSVAFIGKGLECFEDTNSTLHRKEKSAKPVIRL